MTNELQRYYSDLRERNRRLLEQRAAECDKKSPRFRALDSERGLVMQKFAAGKMTKAAALSRIGAIRAERQRALIDLGLPANYLEPIYTCPVCKDTGEVGEGVKRLCACALKKMQQDERAGSRINERETFASFDEGLYVSDEQKKQALNMRRFSERYVASLPSPEKPNLLILGKSGLGKSYFGNAIAFAAIEAGVRGVNTLFFTKSLMDLVSSAMLASGLGFGVMLSAVFVLVFQGLLVLLAGWIAPVLTPAAIAEMTAAGSLIMVALGLNLLGVTKIKVADYLPAIVIAPVICWIVSLF